MNNPKTPCVRLIAFNLNAQGSTLPEDIDAIGGAGALRTAGSLMKMTVTEAAAAVRVLRARYSGARATEESIDKVRKAADSIGEFLGGIP